MNGPDEQERRLETFLIAESGQAWDHYRHVENQRNQYLAFFFTLLTAYLGLLVIVFTQAASSAEVDGLVTATVTAPIVATLGAVVLASIRRFGHVLRFYHQVIVKIRRSLVERADGPRSRWILELDVYNNLPPNATNRWSGAQRTAEVSVAFPTFALLGTPVYLLVSAFWEHYAPWEYAVAAILLPYSLAVAVVLARLLWVGRRPLLRAK